jgi:hypothetical protein
MSNFYLIFVAVIVIVRLFEFLRKRAENQTRKRTPPPPRAGIEAAEAESAALARDNGEGIFSARNLIARLSKSLRKWAESLTENRLSPPLAGIEEAEAESGSRDGEGKSFGWNLYVKPQKPVPPPDRKTVSSPPLPPPVIPEAAPLQVSVLDPEPQSRPGETALVLDGTRPSKAAGSFWERLNALPALKQGVILSEVLSPPKGLSA